ncbi:MAG TPA: oligosaccharide flippase family protein [Methylotenera sp.]|nr:oligosaccharide flippase family protein [Methylotenera sp.]HPH06116.1 oligosaccharide flippase family protein [Methylotenera sp.]HPN00327.1 oligosaccharide flippase family protein [Methylotenera sp.]
MFKNKFNTFGWAFADQALVSGMNFLTGLLLARFLGPVQYGFYIMVWVFVLLSNSVQSAVVVSPMMSIGPKKSQSESASYYGSVFILQSLTALIAFVILILGVLVTKYFRVTVNIEDYIFALPAAAIFYQVQDFIRKYFFTVGKPRSAFVSDMVSYCGQVLGFIALYYFGKLDAVNALWVSGATSLLAFVVTIPIVGQLTYSFKIFEQTTRRHWQFSKWLVGSALLSWTTGNTLLITAATILGAATVGSLRAAQNLFAVTQVILLALNNVLPRQASNVFAEAGNGALKRFLKKSVWICLFFTFPVVLILVMAPEYWLNLFYGEKYLGYGYIFIWLAVSYLLASLILPIQIGLNALEFTRPFFWTSLITTIVSLAISLPLVNRFALNGVLFGMIFNQLITGVILIYQFRLKSKS